MELDSRGTLDLSDVFIGPLSDIVKLLLGIFILYGLYWEMDFLFKVISLEVVVIFRNLTINLFS